MANEEHVAILKKGVAAWNEWREANPQVVHVDLSGAILVSENLVDVNLNGAKA